jgi:hypothetical protein
MIVASVAPWSETIAHLLRDELHQVARTYHPTLSAPPNRAATSHRLGVTNARSLIFSLANTPLASRGDDSADGHGGAQRKFSSHM